MARPATRRGEGLIRDGSWPQRSHERDERVDFSRVQILAIGRHVAATLQNLTDELIARLARRDAVERRPALSAFTAEAVAGPALLVLQHQRALKLERSPALDVPDRCGGRGPRLHLRRPRNRHAEGGQRRNNEYDDQDREDGDGTTLPALLSRARKKRHEEERRYCDHGPDQNHDGLGPRRKQREQRIEREKVEVGL